MSGSGPLREHRITRPAPPEGWMDAPANRWWFQHVDALLATAPVRRGDRPALAFGQAPLELDLDDWLERSCTDGILVLRGRDIATEHYRNGMGPVTRHLLMSVSKSVAVEFGERYDDPDSEVQTQDRVAGWRARRAGDPPDSQAFLTSLRRSGRHGAAFHYCSAGTDVLGWIVERVTARGYAAALSEGLWARLGAERDAFVSVDPAGFAAANGGVCASLRDLARRTSRSPSCPAFRGPTTRRRGRST